MNTLLHFLLLLCQSCHCLRSVFFGGRILGLIKVLITVGWVWWRHQRGPFLVLPRAPPTLNPPLHIISPLSKQNGGHVLRVPYLISPMKLHVAHNTIKRWTSAKHYFQHPWHPWHQNVVPGKAQVGHTGTFSMLFRVDQGLHSATFSFLLIFSDLGKKWPNITGVIIKQSNLIYLSITWWLCIVRIATIFTV